MIVTIQWSPKTPREPRKQLNVWCPDDPEARAKFTGPDFTRDEIVRIKRAAETVQNWADSFLIDIDKKEKA